MTVVKMPNKKVPGILPPPPKTEIDGKIKDLSKFTEPQLLDLLNRQNKILRNSAFISKLPDKGSKIKDLKQKIEEQLKLKDTEESTREMFEKLNLSSADRDSVQNIEWKGEAKKQNTYLDSDDDSEPEDEISVLCQNTMHERKVKVEKKEESFITDRDLQDIYPPDQIQHVKYIMSKTETSSKDVPEKFMPYKTTKSNVHDPSKEVTRKKHKNWEITAATPPPIVHGPVKILSLQESVKLQTEQNKLIREVETKHAAERLMTRVGIGIGQVPDSAMTSKQYREVVNGDSEASDDEKQAEISDNEVYDEEPDRGGVVFTVMK